MRLTCLMLGLLTAMGVCLPILAVENEGIPTKGKLGIASQTTRMVAGKTYEITIEGRDFTPLIVVDPTGLNTSQMGTGNKVEVYFTPTATKDYKILISGLPTKQTPSDTLTYTMHVNESSMRVGLILQREVKIDGNDPVYAKGGRNFPYKSYNVQMQKGNTYTIDLKHQSGDPYLYLEDAEGNILMENDDNGESLASRIIFTPAKTGQHKIICTSCGGTVGDCELTVNSEQGVKQGLRPGGNPGLNQFGIPVPPFPGN